jgi:hypothetical protein
MIEARIVVASLDTDLRYAEAVGRLNVDSGRNMDARDERPNPVPRER